MSCTAKGTSLLETLVLNFSHWAPVRNGMRLIIINYSIYILLRKDMPFKSTARLVTDRYSHLAQKMSFGAKDSDVAMDI